MDDRDEEPRTLPRLSVVLRAALLVALISLVAVAYLTTKVPPILNNTSGPVDPNDPGHEDSPNGYWCSNSGIPSPHRTEDAGGIGDHSCSQWEIDNSGGAAPELSPGAPHVP